MTNIGTDCDLVLVHPDVYDGNPYGFVLTPDPNFKSSSVSIQREITEEGDITVYIFFTIVLADDLKNPDGSEHTESRQEMYEMIMDYLSHSDGLCVGTVIGTWLGIGPLGHSATELHQVNGSFISVKLGNVSTYHAPVSSELFFGSEWQPETPEDDALTWGSSLWR